MLVNSTTIRSVLNLPKLRDLAPLSLHMKISQRNDQEIKTSVSEMTSQSSSVPLSEKRLHDTKGIQWSGKIKGASTKL